MPKLNDTHVVLLSSASQRKGGSLYPLPDTLKVGARVTKALASLQASGLAEERETCAAPEAHRSDDDVSYGLYVTPAGLRAIGVDHEGSTQDAPAREVQPTPSRSTKAGEVLALLQRKSGATMAELIAATGWLPHTTRAALTGLRKKGHTVTRRKRGEETCYSIAVAA